MVPTVNPIPSIPITSPSKKKVQIKSLPKLTIDEHDQQSEPEQQSTSGGGHRILDRRSPGESLQQPLAATALSCHRRTASLVVDRRHFEIPNTFRHRHTHTHTHTERPFFLCAVCVCVICVYFYNDLTAGPDLEAK